MDYFFTEEQKAIMHLVKSIAEREIRPAVAMYDRSGEFPWPIVKSLAKNDIFRVFIDESYGGLAGGTPILNAVIVMEGISRICAGIAMGFLM